MVRNTSKKKFVLISTDLSNNQRIRLELNALLHSNQLKQRNRINSAHVSNKQVHNYATNQTITQTTIQLDPASLRADSRDLISGVAGFGSKTVRLEGFHSNTNSTALQGSSSFVSKGPDSQNISLINQI